MGHPAECGRTEFQFTGLLLPTLCSLLTGFQHYAETGFAGHHAVVGFLGFFEGIGFDHGLDAGEGAEFEGVFGVHAGAGGPAGDGAAAKEQREWADDDGSVFGCANEDEFAGGGEAVDDPFEGLGAGDGGEDDVGATDFLELFRRVLRGGVDVNVRAELLGERSLVLAAGDGDGAIAGLGGVLDGEVAEPAEADDGYSVAGASLPKLRRALKVVMPAQRSGAASTSERSSGTKARALAGAMT